MCLFDFDDKMIDKYIRKEIRRWIKSRYRGILKLSEKVNSDGKYEASSCRRIEVTDKKIEHLTKLINYIKKRLKSFMLRLLYMLTMKEKDCPASNLLIPLKKV